MYGNTYAGIMQQTFDHIVFVLYLKERLLEGFQENEGSQGTKSDDELTTDGLIQMVLKASQPASVQGSGERVMLVMFIISFIILAPLHSASEQVRNTIHH